MRRATGRRAGVVVSLALLAGCGPEKVAPKEVAPRSTERAGPHDAAVPDKSDPAAAAVVGRCVAAATDNHPERIAKTKATRVALTGRMARPGGSFVQTARRFDSVWADRFRLADEFTENGAVALTCGLRRPDFWIRVRRDGATTPVAPPDPQRAEAVFAAEVMGRHWLTLLTPLADPATVVFDSKKLTADGRPADAIKVAVKGYPVFTASFDAATGHLGRVDFTSVEARGTVQKTSTVSLPKAFGGLLLPTRLEYRENGQLLEEWTVEQWEFPDTIDDVTFDPPK